MAIPPQLRGKLLLPALAAPMFLVSGPALVIETCKAGISGTFPALNSRTGEDLDRWLTEITSTLAAAPEAAPFGVNLIVHKTNARLMSDLQLLAKFKVPIVITSLGSAPEVVTTVHHYGGVVFHDVISSRHAQKALQAGVDGIIAVAAGAGGHAGTISPFAMVDELRSLVGSKTLILAGSISTGGAIAAARAAGADLAYLGTRFIATQESMAAPEYKAMLMDATSKDVIYTPKISGVNANFLVPSITRAGLDIETLAPPTHLSVGGETRAWKSIWSAGHGVGAIRDIPTAAALVARLRAEYAQAIAAVKDWEFEPG